MRVHEQFSLGPFMTFSPAKRLPIHRWFFYKEAFSPQLVFHYLDRAGIGTSSTNDAKVCDPCCGIGTTLLAAKSRGIVSIGGDVSPLPLLVSRVKTRTYTPEDVARLKREKDALFSRPFQKIPDPWVFELFPIRRAFSPYAYQDILFFRHCIEEMEEPWVRSFFLLALLSVIPEVSYVQKDGGVLKIAKKHRALPPVKFALKRKLKHMLRDIERAPIQGPEPQIYHGDARRLPIEGNTISCIITSPPYLNNVDYTKVYGIELSLLHSPREVETIRAQSIRSFITRDTERCPIDPLVETLLGEVQKEHESRIPDVAYAYLTDMLLMFREAYRVLQTNGMMVCVVGNAVFPSLILDIDVLCARLAEEIGFEASVEVGNVRIAGGSKGHPLRESAVVLCKQ